MFHKDMQRTASLPWVLLTCLTSMLIISACGAIESSNDKELKEQKQVLEAEIGRLAQEVANAQGRLQKNQEELDIMLQKQEEDESRIQQLNEENKELIAEIKDKLSAIEELEAELQTTTHNLDEISRKLNETEKTISEKESLIKALEGQLADITEGDPEFFNIHSQLQKAKSSLKEAEAELARLQNSLKEAQYLTVQAYLENLGPERLFALDDRDLRRTYNYAEDIECHFIFSLNDKVDFLHHDIAGSVPTLSGFQAFPLGVTYHKVAICGPRSPGLASTFQLHHETGRVFKIIPNNNPQQRSLLTARYESTCGKASSEVAEKNVFGRQFQFIYPYSGMIDGIESIGILRPSNQSLEYTMGSSVTSIRASSCEQLLDRAQASGIAFAACQYINNQENFIATIEPGCMLEGPSINGMTRIEFHPLQ